ncbi:MAG: hypothetical protein JW814_06590 [Candidatus Krumholzibacteriota bacterium]|nr:hypothetical protein [Candidatus Krumholzibacteriota bacterium]
MIVRKEAISGVILLSVSMICLYAGKAAAESSRHRFSGDTREFGIILGEPTGLTYKEWTGSSTAFDLGVAWSFRREGHIHIHADYLFHNFLFFEVEGDRMPYYIGFGARVRIEDDPRAGARFVIGAEYYHNEVPLGFFFELAPIFDLIPETEFDMNGGVGVRVVF